MVEEQLVTCVEGYLQLTTFLNDNKEHLEAFANARASIISGISTLNSMLTEWKPCVGRLCVTPRQFDGVMDVAIILSCEGEGMWRIIWLYPRNVYEIFSTGIRIGENKLTEYSQSMQNEMDVKLKSLSHGDSVLVRDRIGTFVPGTLQKRLTRGFATSDSNDTILEIKIENGLTVNVDESVDVVIPNIVLAARMKSGDDIGSAAQKRRGVHVYHVDDDEPCSSSDSDCERSGESKDIHAHALDGLRTLQAEGHVLGGWERHTKGTLICCPCISPAK
jgi:hypothetical protein